MAINRREFIILNSILRRKGRSVQDLSIDVLIDGAVLGSPLVISSVRKNQQFLVHSLKCSNFLFSFFTLLKLDYYKRPIFIAYIDI